MSKQMDMYNAVCEASMHAHRTGSIVNRARSIENTLCVAIGSNVTMAVSASEAETDKDLLEAAKRMQAAFTAFNAEAEAFTAAAARFDHAATVDMFAKIGACAFAK